RPTYSTDLILLPVARVMPDGARQGDGQRAKPFFLGITAPCALILLNLCASSPAKPSRGIVTLLHRCGPGNGCHPVCQMYSCWDILGPSVRLLPAVPRFLKRAAGIA